MRFHELAQPIGNDMPIILVVDDNETDRQLIGGLLKPKLDWIVQYAKDGAEALEQIGALFPDVVVTDLQMPELNGIQLCAEAKAEFPHVPIILVTGQGSEELAVEAMQAGATSYVPKSGLAKYLLETVEQILSLSNRDKSKARLIQEHTSSARYQFSLPADQSLVAPLVDFISSTMSKLGIGDQGEQRHVSVALEESILNALFHGVLELDSESARAARQQLHDGGVSELVESKSQESPYKDRKIKIAVDLNRNQVSIVVRHDGVGFNVSEEVERAAQMSQLSSQDCRGLALINTIMNGYSFDETGNELKMQLKISSRSNQRSAVATE